MNRTFVVLVVISVALTTRLQAQVFASFSLSANSTTLNGTSVTGWTNVFGDPHIGTLSGTSNGITLTSISTSNWVTDASGICAEDAAAPHFGTFFPDNVLRNHWFQAGTSAAFNQALPQIRLYGLNKDSFYIIRLSSSSNYTAGDPTQYTVAGNIIYPSQTMYPYNNLATGVTFQHIYPNASGVINVYVNTTPGKNVAYLAGVQIISGTSTVGIPTVAITSPGKNDILANGSNVTINASASEPGSSISKVEFYSDTTKLGESTTAPYSFSWVNPGTGHYTIKAKATDLSGTSATDSVRISIASLASFWSTAGNTATGDSGFIGTLDTSRLGFRTNNIERMNISKSGNITIGGKDTSSHPAFRVYNNGDLVAGTTMNRSVDTKAQVGMRYYSRLSTLQIGASDRLDTNQVETGYPTSALVINTDETNTMKGRMENVVFAGDVNIMDTLTNYVNCLLVTEGSHFTSSMGFMGKTIVGGYGTFVSAPVTNSIITGNANQITKPLDISSINGFVNTTADTASGSLISGALNQFGGASQLVSGQFLINRTPLGTTLGNSNVDFATLPFTGSRQINVPNIDQYPLLAIGNGGNASGSIRSNALTVLFNGRTQINTSGFTNQLTQANVTPAAALDVVSTNTGVLLPRLTNAQRNAIVAGDLKNGLLLYNTDSSVFQYYNGSLWNSVGSGGSGSSGRWLFSTGTSGTVYDTDDNVAIGTNDAKGYKLAVKGSGLFTKIQVLSVANWPDYVFKKEYRLRKLEDLAGYIDKYHHLPEIVSAASVGKEGLDLGANQAAILKKVEELTLYLIEENKRLSSQNNHLEEQSKKLTEQGAQLAEQEKRLAEQNALFQQQQRQIDELKALMKKK